MESYAATRMNIDAIILTALKPKLFRWALFVNPFPTTEVRTTLVRKWWHEEAPKIAPGEINREPPKRWLTSVRVPQ